MSGSHFIKDENGDFHELNDEEYGEMQRQNTISTAGAIMGGGAFLLALIYVFIDIPFSYIMWGGIAVTVIGILILLGSASKSEFWGALVAVLIIYVLIGLGARWLRDKLNDGHEQQEKQEQEIESNNHNIIYGSIGFSVS